MKNVTRSRFVVVAACIGSLLLPPGTRAGELAGFVTVRDLALDTSGNLRGTLLTAEGKPQAKSEVALRKGNDVVGHAVTQADGTFLILQVRPGLYELATSHSTSVYRVWSARTAPPAAQTAAMLVQGNVVRGQDWSPIRRGLILSGVIITSGVIGGVIGYNIKDDDSAS